MAMHTYAQLKKQIAALEAQAAQAKSEEVAGVVTRVKDLITSYGLTPQDLFGGKSGMVKSKTKAKSATKAKPSVVPKYVDGKGGQWVGRGKRPRWLSDALAAGKRLEDFLVEKFEAAVDAFSSPAVVIAPTEKWPAKKATKKMAKQTSKRKPIAAGKKAAGSAKYADGAGNSWSGFGPSPRWLKEAVAGGKTREDFLVKG